MRPDGEPDKSVGALRHPDLAGTDGSCTGPDYSCAYGNVETFSEFGPNVMTQPDSAAFSQQL